MRQQTNNSESLRVCLKFLLMWFDILIVSVVTLKFAASSPLCRVPGSSLFLGFCSSRPTHLRLSGSKTTPLHQLGYLTVASAPCKLPTASDHLELQPNLGVPSPSKLPSTLSQLYPSHCHILPPRPTPDILPPFPSAVRHGDITWPSQPLATGPGRVNRRDVCELDAGDRKSVV